MGNDEIERGPSWLTTLSAYARPSRKRALAQLASTLPPYLALWAAMAWMLGRGWPVWTLLPLHVLAAGLLVRLFIFFHDATHGSFFASRRANAWTGRLLGFLTLTPFAEWRSLHLAHHATAGDLDRRGKGDIWTMTVAEYRDAGRLTRLRYRLARHPLTMLIVGPALLFLLVQRLPRKGATPAEHRSVWLTNLGLLAGFGLAAWVLGPARVLWIQLPVTLLAGAGGIWLFYVQHQYEGAYWQRHEDWEPVRAALEGSSWYKLPRPLQWITGNIGIHHLHHLRPRIPNYRLQACLDAVEPLRRVQPLTIRRSLRSLFLHLWDEESGRLVGYRALRSRRA